MRRTWYIWLAFSLCLTVVLAAMAWISLRALRLERVEEQAQAQAAVEEKIRLSLWRMDSALTPLITQETSRPYFTYLSFHPLDRAYNRMFAELKPDDVLVPSPLLTLSSPSILLHFQISPDGKISSPQAPAGNELDLAQSAYTSAEVIQVAQKRLEQLRLFVQPKALLVALPAPSDAPPQPIPMPNIAQAQAPNAQPNLMMNQQMAQNTIEFTRRSSSISNAIGQNVGNPSQRANPKFNTDSTASVQEGLAKAIWVGPNLLLAQRVMVGGNQYVQGCWLDWTQIRTWLLGEASDLLPNAALEPCPGRASNQEYMLAALPVRLLPGRVTVEAADQARPVAMSLAIAWACLLAGAAAVAIVLHKAVSLSERRGAFVSAVTHEMRTPLTTFRLYADLLAGGMIGDEVKRQSYLRRLCDEAQRLSHLVENVLAYARLSGPRKRSPVDTVRLGELVERSRDRLSSRAQQAKMELVIEPADGAGVDGANAADAAASSVADTAVAARSSAVEQILMNLVDNACKYAAGASDRRIHVEIGRTDGAGLLRVRDHGPGLAAQQIKRLFQPFCRSAHEAAGSAPGVGLGLALSRRLARDMRGELDLDRDYTAGASFTLRLPKAKA